MIYYNNTFKGYWPVGASAIVSAHTRSGAAAFLELKLEEQGLKQIIGYEDMISIGELEAGTVIILQDGNY